MKFRQNFRSKIYPRLDNIIDRFGLYAKYSLSNDEKIATLDIDKKEIVSEIKDMGYEYNTLSASKEHPVKSITDHGSFRKVPESHPQLNGDPDILRWSPHKTQYHIHIFEIEDKIELFSHYELRPDLISPYPSLRRLRVHYRPEWNENYLLGVVDPELANFLNSRTKN